MFAFPLCCYITALCYCMHYAKHTHLLVWTTNLLQTRQKIWFIKGFKHTFRTLNRFKIPLILSEKIWDINVDNTAILWLTMVAQETAAKHFNRRSRRDSCLNHYKGNWESQSEASLLQTWVWNRFRDKVWKVSALIGGGILLALPNIINNYWSRPRFLLLQS